MYDVAYGVVPWAVPCCPCGVVPYGAAVAYGSYDNGVLSAKEYSGTSSCRGTRPGAAKSMTAKISGTASKGYQKCSVSCSVLFLTVTVANTSRTSNNREIATRM